MRNHRHPALAPFNTLAALAALATATFLPAAPAHAGEQQGVKCPAGYDARISQDHRKLVCSKTTEYAVKPLCSPLVFSARGITVSGNVVMDTRGADKCLAVASGQTIEPQFTGLPVGVTDYQVKRTRTDADGPDSYTADVTRHAFPEGGPVFIGDAGKGVQCPAGFDGDRRFNGRGIRCDKNDGAPKRADCDGVHAGIVSIGWKLDIDKRGHEDRCVPTAGGESGPTKPEGMTKVQHDAERASDRIGWVLKDRDGRDSWQRKVYEYPKSDLPL
ncbi:MAG: hypothetical protein JNL30_04825 [Rubrivivax sp.]|nr:hypothetical protein [Rubrivivax sp.]